MGVCLGCIHQGRFDEAMAAYNEGLSKDPKNEGAHKEKVEVESARKALAQARELMQKVRRRATCVCLGYVGVSRLRACLLLSPSPSYIDQRS